MWEQVFHGHELATILWTFVALFGFMGLPMAITAALMWAEKKDG